MTTLRYLGWEGYADGSFAASLRKNTDLEIIGENHLSDSEAGRRLRSSPQAWDIININTPFVRDVLYPEGLIQMLPDSLRAEVDLTGVFSRFKSPAESRHGNLIGIPQRCGPFNIVINEKRISPSVAEEQGFRLALNPDFSGRFGILTYEDFNIIHFALAAGLNPFTTFDSSDIATFAHTAHRILRSAHIVTCDHGFLNRALLRKEIDFYISGGSYTASSARLAGRLEVRAITPSKGPIAGKGGIAFVEINAITHCSPSKTAGIDFLQFLISDSGAVAGSLAGGACNPVVQMHRRSMFARFSVEHLLAMQWNEFEEDMSRCAEYEIIPDYEKLAVIIRAATVLSAANRN
jgi:spermidine/putrescine transport system substrate-binding protein